MIFLGLSEFFGLSLSDSLTQVIQLGFVTWFFFGGGVNMKCIWKVTGLVSQIIQLQEKTPWFPLQSNPSLSLIHFPIFLCHSSIHYSKDSSGMTLCSFIMVLMASKPSKWIPLSFGEGRRKAHGVESVE